MEENTREQKFRYLFSENPKLTELHVTSDEQAFTHKSDAINHAKTLDNRDISLEKRSDYPNPQANKQRSAAAQAKEIRDALLARHAELFGNDPAKNAKDENIAAKIKAEEERLMEVAKKDKESEAADQPA